MMWLEQLPALGPGGLAFLTGVGRKGPKVLNLKLQLFEK